MRITLLLFILFASISTTSAAVAPAKNATPATTQLTAADLTRDAVEARIGRKLKFKERIALSMVRGKAKRAERRQVRGGATDGLAIASLVCGILGLFLFWLAVPALVLGIISLDRYSNGIYHTGKGIAIAGIVLGGIVILAILVVLVLFASIFGFS